MGNYNKFKSEIETFINESITPFVKTKEELEELLMGWRIMYSNVIHNPKILLVGINPGGQELQHYEHLELEPLSTLEYIDNQKNDYALARDTVRLFEMMEYSDLLKETCKTNGKFYATKGTWELYEFEKKLKLLNPTLYVDLVNNSIKWTRMLCDGIIKPKLIICEGVTSFNYVSNVVYSESEGWEYNLLSKEKDDIYWKRKSDGLIIYGYKRKRNGGILDIDYVAETLKPLIDNL